MQTIEIDVRCIFDYSQGLPNQRQRIKYGKGKAALIRNDVRNYARHTFVNFERVRLEDGSYTIDTTEKLIRNPIYTDDKLPFISRKLVGNEIVLQDKRRLSHAKSKGLTVLKDSFNFEGMPKTVEKLVIMMLKAHKKDFKTDGRYKGNWVLFLKVLDAEGKVLRGSERPYNHMVEVHHKNNGKLQVNTGLYRFLTSLIAGERPADYTVKPAPKKAIILPTYKR